MKISDFFLNKKWTFRFQCAVGLILIYFAYNDYCRYMAGSPDVSPTALGSEFVYLFMYGFLVHVQGLAFDLFESAKEDWTNAKRALSEANQLLENSKDLFKQRKEALENLCKLANPE